MSLTAGTHLGPYEIATPLGAGGMGEVYKATDTRHDRTVAIKVLPEHIALDADPATGEGLRRAPPSRAPEVTATGRRRRL